MSCPAPRVVGGGGGSWRVEPPIAREVAEKLLDAKIPLQTWERIREAFHIYGEELELLRAPTPKAYASALTQLRGRASKLERSLKALEKHREMLDAVEMAAMREPLFRRGRRLDLGDLVRRMANDLNRLQMALAAAAEPDAQAQVQSEADAKKNRLRRVQAALVEIGVNTRPPAVFKYEFGDDQIPLTPFAELVLKLEMHNGGRAALATWLTDNLDRRLFAKSK